MKLVIANKNYSSWSMRAWLLMRSFNLDFEEIQESLNGDDLGERLRRYSPSCKVPVLIDGDLTIWDSLSICEYISENHLHGRGWPGDPTARAHARSVSAEMHSSFMALRSEMPMNIRAKRSVLPAAATLKDIRRINDIWTDCRSRYHQQGDFLFGDFSIADCMFAPVVMRFQTYGADLSEQSRAYMTAMLNHDAIRDWINAALAEKEIVEADEAGE